jgi:AraC-like DNA-binding protein
MLESAAGDRKRLRGKSIATQKAVSPSHLSGLVHHETGFYFTEWRSAYLLRPALPLLTNTHEHVKQIACRLLGFSHESQFNHEFKALLGLSPTEFRNRSQRNIR